MQGLFSAFLLLKMASQESFSFAWASAWAEERLFAISCFFARTQVSQRAFFCVPNKIFGFSVLARAHCVHEETRRQKVAEEALSQAEGISCECLFL